MKTKEKGKKRNRKTILKRAGIIIGILLFFVMADGRYACSGCQQD